MTNNLNRSLLFTAAVLTFSAAAYAQNDVTANVPFSFKANGTSQKPGMYNVIANRTSATLQLLDKSTGKSIQLGNGIPEGATGAAGDARPRLVFHCSDDGGCLLAEVWIGDGRGWSYNHTPPKGPKFETAVAVYYGGEVTK